MTLANATRKQRQVLNAPDWAILGPCICQGCRRFLVYWNGMVWCNVRGETHRCPGEVRKAA